MNAFLTISPLLDPDAIESAKRWIGTKIGNACDVENGGLVLAILYQWTVWVTERPDEFSDLFHPFEAASNEPTHLTPLERND